MYSKRRRKHPWIILVFILSIAVLATGSFLLFTNEDLSPLYNKNDVPAAAPVTFAGAIKAIELREGAFKLIQGEATREAHKQAIDTALDFAAQNNYDAILFELADESGLYCRIKGFEPSGNIKELDKLFDKWDPLKYASEGAIARKLGLFASFKASAAHEELISAVEEKYAVSGVYIRESADAGQSLLNTVYTGVNGEPELVTPSLAASYPELCALASFDKFGGLVFGEYPASSQNYKTLTLWASLFNEAEPLVNLKYEHSTTLALTYPANTQSSLYTKTCFLMGTSDPNLPLSINGEEVPRFGVSGAFGVLVELKIGANSFILSQGTLELAFTLTRKTYSSSTSTAQDATVAAEIGQQFEITTGIASGLTDPNSDSAINETFKKGAKASVVESVRTTRSGKKTWAYKLSTGDYILAKNVKLLTDNVKAAFSATSVAKGEYGEVISFDGAGTPLIYTNKEGNALVLNFLDTELAENLTINGSDYIDSVAISKNNADTSLILQLTDKKLWGWDISYKDGKTQLFLKYPPIISDEFGKPLSGVRIMLDPGHGDKDSGALGVGGQSAPAEKHVNLSVAQSAKHYLEQLGASVIMTRSDDTFKTLDERLIAQSDEATDFFISVHHNSVELTVNANETTGVECYYFYKTSQLFADALCKNISEASARLNRESKYGYFYVTRTTIAPSVLLETGFMVNPLEYESVTNDEIIHKTGAAIAQSIFEQLE